MVAIKDIEMPKSCREVTTRPFYSDEIVYNDCPFYNVCKYKEIIETNVKSNSCPLVEIVTCKECSNHVKGALDEDICLRGHELIYDDFYCADAERSE